MPCLKSFRNRNECSNEATVKANKAAKLDRLKML